MWSHWEKTIRVFMSVASTVLLTSIRRTIGGCPDRCFCSVPSKRISCEGAGFTELPEGIRSLSATTLDLRGNLLTRLGSDTWGILLRDVVRLTLTGNRLEAIEDGAFREAGQLQVLELGGNSLSRVTRAMWRGADGLVQLNLSSNLVDRIDDGAFEGMRGLSRLDLSGNRIPRVTRDTLRGLSNLRYLDLSHNSVAYLAGDAFVDLERLVHLALKANPIPTATEFQFRSSFLSYVDLSECSLARVPRGLPSTLRYLQLRRNNITAIGRLGSFGGHSMLDLAILVLDENSISSWEDNHSSFSSFSFASMARLQQLWLNFNRFKRIPKLSAGLQRLLLESNAITELLSDSFPEHSRMDTLSLAGNFISSIEGKALHRLTELQSLDLSNNRLVSIDGGTFVENKQLRTLQLSRNPLVELKDGCFHGLFALRQLSLAFVSTPVVRAGDDIFRDLESLERIDLDCSPGLIKALTGSDDLLASLASVRELSMRHSGLQTLRSDFPEFLPNMAILRLSSSRWHCDKRMLWFKVWSSSSSSVTSVKVVDAADSNRCHSPAHLRNRSITHLSDEEFAPAVETEDHEGPPELELRAFPPDASNGTRTTDFGGYWISFPPEASGQSESSELSPQWPPTMSFSTRRPDEVMRTYSSLKDRLRPRTETNYSPDRSKKASKVVDPTSSSSTVVVVIIVSFVFVSVVVVGVIIVVVLFKNRRWLSDDDKWKKCEALPEAVPGVERPPSDHNTGYFLRSSAAASIPPTMSLVPGRDVNHEGPRRVYKWTDF